MTNSTNENFAWILNWNVCFYPNKHTCNILSGPESFSVSLGFSPDFSSNTKQLMRAQACCAVRSLNTPLNNSSVVINSSPLKTYESTCTSFMSRDARNPVFGVSYQVPHKPACTVSEKGLKLENLDFRRTGIVLSLKRKQRH